MKALYVMDEDMLDNVTNEKIRKRIADCIGEEPGFATYQQVRANLDMLNEVEYLFPSYGFIGSMDEEFLNAAPNLKIVFAMCGSVRGITSNAFWERNIPITCAAKANAVPVAEFVLGEILLYMKGFFFHSKNMKENFDENIYHVHGLYNRKIGIISYGDIAKHLNSLLKNSNMEVCVWSPELDEKRAADEGMTYMSLRTAYIMIL